MNSLQLIQGVCRKWLTVPDQTALDLSAVQDLLDGINLVQAEVWRALPVHYKRQSLSLDFYGPAPGTVSVTGYGSRAISAVTFPTIMDVLTYLGEPLTYEGEPLLFNGSAVMENPRPYCRIDITGDQQNIFDGTVLRHPYLGSSTGVVDATLYHDAKLASVMIERVLSPVVDRVTGNPYFHVERHGPGDRQPLCRAWTMRRILHVGVMRTLVELTPGHDTVAVLAFDALVAPSALTLGSSQRPVDLPYDTEVAGFITAMAGANLRQHPAFNRDLFSAADTREVEDVARTQLVKLSPRSNSQFIPIGTPHGW